MKITTEDWGMKRIHLDEPLPQDFAARLLREMIQIARPYGASRRVAEAVEDNQTDMDDIVAAGLRSASVDYGGHPHANGDIHFDYVAGLRIKVSIMPNGSRDLSGNPTEHDMGYPIVKSRDFDQMYGEGALEGVVRLALM